MNHNKEKCRQIADDFDCHAYVAVQCGAHRPIDHIPGFTRSHWMLTLGECSHRIAAAAALVDESITQNANKKQFLAS